MASNLALDALRAGCLAMVAEMASEFIIAYRVSEPISRGDNVRRCQTGFGKSHTASEIRLGRMGGRGRTGRTLARAVGTRGHFAGRTCSRTYRAGTRPGPTTFLWRRPLVEPP